jgi:hypothetical protein
MRQEATVGIPLGKKAREVVTTAKEVVDKTSTFIKVAVGLSLLALGVAFVALFRTARAA